MAPETLISSSVITLIAAGASLILCALLAAETTVISPKVNSGSLNSVGKTLPVVRGDGKLLETPVPGAMFSFNGRASGIKLCSLPSKTSIVLLSIKKYFALQSAMMTWESIGLAAFAEIIISLNRIMQYSRREDDLLVPKNSIPCQSLLAGSLFVGSPSNPNSLS